MMADRSSSFIARPSNPPSAAPSRPQSGATSSQQLQQEATNLESHFSQSQIALALSIAKSKPQNINIKDYCLQLQKCIQNHRTTPSNRYVDTSEFWKEQYSKIYQEKKALEDKVHRLEALTHCRAENRQEDEQTKSNGSRKRPPESEDIERWVNDQQADHLLDQDNVLALSSYILRIGHQRKDLEKTMMDKDSPDFVDNIVKSSHQIIGLLESVVSDCTLPFWSIRCNEGKQFLNLFQQVMQQIVLGFRCCFGALNILCQTIIGRAKRGDVTYRLVMFLRQALQHLCSVCTLQGGKEIAGKDTARRTQDKRVRTGEEYAVNRYLSQALISIFHTEWKVGQPVHSEILEGFMFCILEHTGRLLSNATFLEHVGQSTRAGNITMGDMALPPEVAKLQTRYIVAILHAALGDSTSRKELVTQVLAERSGDSSASSRQSTLGSSAKNPHELLAKARKRMQETLVTCALGGDDSQGLRLPLSPKEGLNYPSVVEYDVKTFGPEWLIGSVWGLMEWDLAV